MRLRYISILFLLVAVASAQPYSPHVIWDRSGSGDSSRYGITYALGDQNEDGRADFAVWALGWGGMGQPSEALAELFHGGNPPDTIPYMSFRARPDDYQFYRFQTVGDLNGDGFIDWQIWRVPVSDPNQITFETYWGGPNADTIPDLIFHGPWTGNVSLIPAGDFNGDGFDDLYFWRSGNPDYGQVLFGGNPMDTMPHWTRHSPPGHPFESLPRSFGDANGDGFSDFVSGSPDENLTYVYVGAANPDTLPAYVWMSFYHTYSRILPSLNGDRYADLVFSGYPQWTVHLGDTALSSIPIFAMNFFGNCSWNFATGIGDINGDGYQDMCAIDPGCNNLWGTLCIYLGHPWLNADPAVIIQGWTFPLNLIGINNAAGLGDVNGDGLDDFAIGAFTYGDGFRGRAVILSGDTGLVVSARNLRSEVPRELSLKVYPNPFNAQTTIDLYLPIQTAQVELDVFNVIGQRVTNVTQPVLGSHLTYSLDVSTWASGVYLLTARAGNLRTTQKLMLLR
jgi:hypothetical protein